MSLLFIRYIFISLFCPPASVLADTPLKGWGWWANSSWALQPQQNTVGLTITSRSKVNAITQLPWSYTKTVLVQMNFCLITFTACLSLVPHELHSKFRIRTLQRCDNLNLPHVCSVSTSHWLHWLTHSQIWTHVPCIVGCFLVATKSLIARTGNKNKTK